MYSTYIVYMMTVMHGSFKRGEKCGVLIILDTTKDAQNERGRITPSLRYKIPVFSDPDPGKS